MFVQYVESELPLVEESELLLVSKTADKKC
jgi:hypothetical protein